MKYEDLDDRTVALTMEQFEDSADVDEKPIAVVNGKSDPLNTSTNLGEKDKPFYHEHDHVTDASNATRSMNGSKRFGKIRVNIVGCWGQGKTTLTKRLLSNNHSSDSEDSISTSGIDIKATRDTCWVWEEKNMDFGASEEVKEMATQEHKSNIRSNSSADDTSGIQGTQVTIWDFAGQYMFYATHQLFHSIIAVYLLVVDMSKSLDSLVGDDEFPGEQTYKKTMMDYIQFWLNSIHSFVGSRDGTEPAVILVGTHKDKLRSEKEAEDYLNRIKERFSGSLPGLHIYQEHYAMSLLDPSDESIGRLRNTILKIGRKQNANHTVPMSWIALEEALMCQQSDEILVIHFDRVLEIDSATKAPIRNENEIRECLKFCQNLGTCLYLDEGCMAQYVVVNPTWLIDAFKCIVTTPIFLRKPMQMRPLWQKLYKHAILDEKLVEHVWSDTNMMPYKEILLAYLQHYRIIAEKQQFNKYWHVESLGQFIVPSLLRRTDDGEMISFLDGKPSTQVSLLFQFESESPALTIYHRVTALAVGTWPIIRFKGNELLYENVGVYKINHCHAGLIQKSTTKIEILVISLCTEDEVSAVTSNYFRGFVELIIGKELRRFRMTEAESQEPLPFSEHVRCYDKEHNSKGSIDTYDLDMLKMLKSKGSKRLCCPDHVTHTSLNVERIFQEWFDYKANERNMPVPKVKLTEKEYSTLSMAIGSEWEHFGVELGLKEVHIQHIKMDNETTMKRISKMLLVWDKQFSHNATLDVLVKALSVTPPYSVDWDAVNDLITAKRQ